MTYIQLLNTQLNFKALYLFYLPGLKIVYIYKGVSNFLGGTKNSVIVTQKVDLKKFTYCTFSNIWKLKCVGYIFYKQTVPNMFSGPTFGTSFTKAGGVSHPPCVPLLQALRCMLNNTLSHAL